VNIEHSERESALLPPGREELGEPTSTYVELVDIADVTAHVTSGDESPTGNGATPFTFVQSQVTRRIGIRQ
jgi:hypothetical protein